jgi:hypothetical protein
MNKFVALLFYYKLQIPKGSFYISMNKLKFFVSKGAIYSF